jgi:flagellar hook-associated protein 3 FlgL
MRIASSQLHATMNTALQTGNTDLSKVTQQMAAGMRVQKPSDDTIASMRLSRISRDEAALQQYQDNVGALRSRLQNNETLLDSMKHDMMQVRDLLTWAADGSNTAPDLAAMSGSLESLRDSLMHTANSRDSEGHAIFSGTRTDQPAVSALFEYGGNLETQQVAVGQEVTLSASVSLPEMAGFLKQLDGLAALLKSGVSASTAQPVVKATLVDLDATLGSVTGKIGALGGEQTVLQTLESNQSALSLSNKKSAIDFGQLDYAEAAVRLNNYTLAVQATQKAYAKVSNLSLFNVV